MINTSFVLFPSSTTKYTMAGTSSSSIVKGAYWPSWVSDFPPSSIDTSLFTHLYYAFLLPNNETFELDVSDHSASTLRSFTSTIRSKNPPVKTLLAIGGWSAGGKVFSEMAKKEESRKSFINSCVRVAREYGFDGIDLDWEFPQDSQDMTNLGQLLEELRAQVTKEEQETGNTKLYLTAAVTPTVDINSHPDVPRSYPVNSIDANLDWVNVMCYNYCGNWDTTKTGAHAAWSNPNGMSTRFALKSWIDAGVRPGKLVMGLPLYGYSWTLKDPRSNGIGAAAVGVGPGDNGIMTYSEVERFNRENKNAKFVNDEETVSAYSCAGDRWIGYDDVWSTAAKIQFAQGLGIRGYFFWEVTGDRRWTIPSAASRSWT